MTMTSDGLSEQGPACLSCGDDAEEGCRLCETCQEKFDKDMQE